MLVTEKTSAMKLHGTDQMVFDPYNERVKLYAVEPEELAVVTPEELGRDVASKITVYALPGQDDLWRDIGYQKEAVIQGFFPGDDAHLWATYTNEEREHAPRELIHARTVQLAQTKPLMESPSLLPGFHSQLATVADREPISQLLNQTFIDYPSSITPEVIGRQIEREENLFRTIRNPDGELAAVASAELDHLRGSAEMTDCATLPEMRGMGLMAYLLRALEQDVEERYDIHSLYTIARADEVGINCVFSKLGYEFEGRLINNCRMPNGWESMNVWCRDTLAAH